MSTISAGQAARAQNWEMLDEVRSGLGRPQKELSPKYFYDLAGSLLFEEITRLPEYYLTRVERELLVEHAPQLMTSTGVRTLVELGAGSASKTRILLDAMARVSAGGTYVPIDVSGAFLSETASGLRAAYPGLRIAPVTADVSRDFQLPRHDSPVLFALLGSTIGNFDEMQARLLLRRIRELMGPSDRFLLGADLQKDAAQLNAAYNDAAGVTARFNLNMLQVLNRELGADFDRPAFAHRAFYNEQLHRIEMHLVSLVDQVVTIPGIGGVALAKGESIRTEISCKYDRAGIEVLFTAAGMSLETWHTDDLQRFALAVGRLGVS